MKCYRVTEQYLKVDPTGDNLLTITEDKEEASEFYIKKHETKDHYFHIIYRASEQAPSQGVNHHTSTHVFQPNSDNVSSYTFRHHRIDTKELRIALWTSEYYFIKPARRSSFWFSKSCYLGLRRDMVINLQSMRNRAYFKLERVPKREAS